MTSSDPRDKISPSILSPRTQSLSDSEAVELRALQRDLDTAEAFLYQPVLDRLSAKIQALESGLAK